MKTKRRFSMEKLGRDNVDYFKSIGIEPHIRFLVGEELILALKHKLIEESQEALNTTSIEELIDELADLHEVILTIMSISGISPESVEVRRKSKKSLKGGFEKGVYYHFADVCAEHTEVQNYFINNPEKYPEMSTDDTEC